MIAARILGAPGYGAYTYAVSWASVLARASAIGYPRFLLREVASVPREDVGQLRALMWDASIRVLRASCLIAIASVAVSSVLLSSSFREALWVAAASIPFTAFLVLGQSVLQGLDRSDIAKVPLEIARPVLTILFLGTAAAIGISLSAAAAVALAALALALAAATMLWLCAKALGLSIESLGRQRIRTSPEVSTPGLGLAVTSILLQFGPQLPLLALGFVSSPTEVANFSVAFAMANIGAMGLSAVGLAYAPRMRRRFLTQGVGGLAGLSTQAARIGMGTVVLVSAGLFIASEQLLSLFGEEFVAAQTALAILLGGRAMTALFGPVTTTMLMIGLERHVAVAAASSAVVGVLFTIMVGPSLGDIGAALGSALSAVVLSAWLFIVSCLRTGLDPSVIGSIAKR